MNVCKIAELVANSVDPDQTPHSAQSCLYVMYGNLIKLNHFRNHPGSDPVYTRC